ncbi:MAG TPA: single-stranded DNA-binding protein [Planctomycetota bacterium]|nr:single-stranded DNA-binding protein [Planctomycetota bacterium]
MASLNKVLLIGNLTRDPELKYTPQGTAVCDFAIALNEKFKAKDGSWQEKVHFIDIAAWGRTAEVCGEYLKKGRPVFIEGRLQQDRWEQPDGQKRSKVRVTADRVQFLGGPQGGGGGARGAAPEAAEAPAEAGPEPGPGEQEPPF